MRFSIRDLVLTTTLISLYLAAIVKVTRESSSDFGFGLVAGFGILSSIAVISLFSTGIRRALAGGPLLRLATSYRWKHHFTVATLVVGACVATTIVPGLADFGGMSGYVLLSSLVVHFFMLFSSPAVFFEDGVFVNGSLRTWRRCQFRLLGSVLRIAPPWYERWIARDTRVRIPAEHVEEVRAILEAKQGATDAKTE